MAADDSGVYECVAENVAGVAARTLEIKVLGKLSFLLIYSLLVVIVRWRIKQDYVHVGYCEMA